MLDFLVGMGRYFLVGFGVLGALIGYLYFCDRVYKVWPRVGLALGGVLVVGFVALSAGVGATIYLGSRVGVIVMVPVYAASFVVWVVYVFKKG